jgi:tRNA-specific 2-thiouridylase
LNSENNRYELYRAIDRNKDQSYALWGIRQQSLAKTIFPLGELTKPEVRELARKFNLGTAEKKESQEICFIPDNNYHRLLKETNPTLENEVSNGKMIDTNGKILGSHNGYPFYTIGQRKGLGGGFSEPMYVIDVNSEKNTITVGNEQSLYCSEFIVERVNLISWEKTVNPTEAQIKIRYNDQGHPGMIYPEKDNKLRVVFNDPQKSVTPGQSAVFFDGDLVLGGGIIERKL